jgi:predicted AAA+ superfamily ATPase
MHYVRRSLANTLQRVTRTFPAAVITGPRQSGKTTLLRREFGATHSFVTLEDPDTRARAIDDPRRFLQENPAPVILDEIQYVPDLLSYVKTAIDEDRRPGRWLLSGSQVFQLMRGVSQSLAGRTAVLTLLPFSCREWLGPYALHPQDAFFSAFKPPKQKPPSQPSKAPDLGDWLLRGGFPEPRSNPKIGIADWCSAYLQTYLERDVRNLSHIGDLQAFERFLRLCAARTTQILNLSNLARDTGVSVPTAKAWLSVLEAGHTVFLLPPYHENFGKRLIKAPKLYFTDTALAAHLTGLRDVTALLQGPMAGALFETYVVTAIRKAFLHGGEPAPIYYWRSSDGWEVDLIVEHNLRLYPVEIKLNATPTPHHVVSLERWMTAAGKKSESGLLICGAAKPVAIAENIHAVPWHYF